MSLYQCTFCKKPLHTRRFQVPHPLRIMETIFCLKCPHCGTIMNEDQARAAALVAENKTNPALGIALAQNAGTLCPKCESGTIVYDVDPMCRDGWYRTTIYCTNCGELGRVETRTLPAGSQ